MCPCARCPLPAAPAASRPPGRSGEVDLLRTVAQTTYVTFSEPHGVLAALARAGNMVQDTRLNVTLAEIGTRSAPLVGTPAPKLVAPKRKPRRPPRPAPPTSTEAANWPAHLWLSETLARDAAQELLRTVRVNGAFIVRRSSGDGGGYTISFWADGSIHHYRIKLANGEFVVKGTVYKTLEAVVAAYQFNALYEGIYLAHPVSAQGTEAFSAAIAAGRGKQDALKELVAARGDAVPTAPPRRKKKSPSPGPSPATGRPPPVAGQPPVPVAAAAAKPLTRDEKHKSIFALVKEGTITVTQAEEMMGKDETENLSSEEDSSEEEGEPDANVGKSGGSGKSKKAGFFSKTFGGHTRKKMGDLLSAAKKGRGRKRGAGAGATKQAEPSEAGVRFVTMCVNAVEAKGLDEQGTIRRLGSLLPRLFYALPSRSRRNDPQRPSRPPLPLHALSPCRPVPPFGPDLQGHARVQLLLWQGQGSPTG